MRERGLKNLHHTKTALLIFGLGLVIGFVVVVGEFPEWERTAAAIMALGLVTLPVALFADGRGMALVAWMAARFRRGKGSKPRPKARRAPARRKPPSRTPTRAPRRKRS